MEYGYKITTNGQAAILAALDLGKPLRITRAAVGSGAVEEGADLADVHALKAYAAEAAIVGRRHEGNQLFMTVQYSNRDCQRAFTIGEFMVYAEDPETGRETDFLYAALGDYRQPVPPYIRSVPPGVWAFPLVVAVSGQLHLEIAASPGLITTYDLQDAIDRLKWEIFANELTLPLASGEGEPIVSASGTPILAVHHPDKSAGIMESLASLDTKLTRQISQTADQLSADCAAASARNRAYADRQFKILERRIDTSAGSIAGQIAAAKAEAISTAGTAADFKIAAAKSEAVSAAGIAADTKISAHNTAAEAHPTHLAIIQKT